MKDVSAQTPRRESPWIGFDHGWPWLLAGLILLVSAGVFPSEERLQTEKASVETLRAQRVHALDTVKAYEAFLEGVDSGDDTVIRRLAAAQLGKMPRDHEPLPIMLTGLQDPPTRWIERSVLAEASANPPEASRPSFVNESLLATILAGEGRVWLFGGSILAIFIGLLLDRGHGTGPVPVASPVDSEL